ncbi:MAG TPA: class I SAM-dependent methyltransferase [Geobacteraceae bacterium]
MSKRVCPWWLGYWLLNPLRRLMHNPDTILAPFVAAGMTVLDVGPGMGFFSLPLARMAGPGGKVVCVDLQEKMLRALQRRAAAAGLADRIVARVCTPASLCLDDFEGAIDFALAFAVVHEVPDPDGFFAELSRALKPGAFCLVAEPKGHVSVREFEDSLAIAAEKGLRRVENPGIPWNHAALLKKGQ